MPLWLLLGSQQPLQVVSVEHIETRPCTQMCTLASAFVHVAFSASAMCWTPGQVLCTGCQLELPGCELVLPQLW